MAVYLSKMNPETFAGMSSGREGKLPNPRGRTKFREATPPPRVGDSLLIWVNGHGLLAEARLAEVDDEPRPRVRLDMYMEDPKPILNGDVLGNYKGQAGRPRENIFDTLGGSRTEKGGTIRLSEDEVADLDQARRNVEFPVGRSA